MKYLDEKGVAKFWGNIKEYVQSMLSPNLAGFKGFSGLYNTIEIDDNKVIVDTTNSIFVATLGDDNVGDGSINNPYKTVTKALEVVNAGQTIYIRAGTYNENAEFNKSGEAGKPITLRNYPNEVAVLDCSGLSKEAIVDFNHQSYINVIGLELCNITEVDYSVYGVFARGGEKNLIIANCNIHNINAKSAEEGNASGIKIYGLTEEPCEYILIQNNHIHDCICGWSEALTITANAQFADIIGNNVHDNGNIAIDIVGNFGDVSVQTLDYARYVYVARNEVYNSHSVNADCAGLYCDGASYVIFDSNKSYNNQIGLSIGSEMKKTDMSLLPHNIIAINNLIYNNTAREVEIGGYSEEAGKTFNTYLVNNTIIHFAEGTDVTLKLNIGDGFKIINNIIIDLGTWNYFISTEFDKTQTTNFEFLNNLMYSFNGEEIGAYFNILDTTYTTETFKNASFASNNIITADYLLNEDYTLKEASPAISNGYDITTLIKKDSGLLDFDYANNKRIVKKIDIGCHEYQNINDIYVLL